MKYEIVDHDLLSPDAKRLSPEELTAQGELAELVLGLADSDYTDEFAERAAMAVAIQANYQIALDVEAPALSSWQQINRGQVYKMNVPELHPWAVRIVVSLPQRGAEDKSPTHDAWATVRTLRPVAEQ